MIRQIPEPERGAVRRLFLYCLLTGSSYTLARTAGDSLFLSRIGTDDLAGVFVASGIVTAVLASLWFQVIKRLPLRHSLQVSAIGLGSLTLLAWILLPSLHHSYYLLAIVYVLAEVKGCVNAINIASALNEILGGHSSRKSWALVLAGLPAASVLVGMVIGVEASFVTVGTFLLFSAVLDLVSALPVWRLCSFQVPPRQAPVTPRPRTRDRLNEAFQRYVCADRFGRWIGILIAAKVFVLTIVAFEWKVAANHYYGVDEQALAGYFGIFYAVTGLATLLVQFLITGRLLSNRSVLFPILVMPVALLALNLLMVSGSGVVMLLVITTLAKSMDVWRRSAHDTALQILYTRIERDKRRDVIGFNNAFVKPLAEVAASLVLMLGSWAFHQSLLVIVTLLWLLAIALLLRLLRNQMRSPDVRSGLEQLVSRLADNG
jgi:ATP/ADP translocase